MSIIKEKNGTYTLSYTKRDMVTQSISRTKKRGFRTQKEAREYERSLSRESSVVTFKSLLNESMQSRELAKSTRYDTIKTYEKYLKFLDCVPYETLTKPYLVNLRIKVSELPIANGTKNKILGIVRTTCKFAHDIYDLEDNGVVLKKFKIQKKEMQVWTMEEYYQFEDALKTFAPKLVPFFHTLMFTGMRKGEARALLVDDLDVENATLNINKSMSKYRTSIKSTKTDSSNRIIKLDAITLELLKPLKSNEKWLFGDYNSLNLNTIELAFSKAIAISGVPKIRIHDLRHSHATYLICNGANIVAVSKRLGHSTIDMTLQTYTHLLRQTESELIAILDNVATW